MDADEIAAGRARWQARYDAARKRDADFTTLSGMSVEPVYGPPEGAAYPGFDRIAWPGEFPYTRGLYPTGYRGRTWTIRQFAGFGNARQTNERYKMILGAGGGGLSVAFDMPTLMGRDSDDPQSLGEVGHCGVAVDSAADMEVLFDGIVQGEVDWPLTGLHNVANALASLAAARHVGVVPSQGAAALSEFRNVKRRMEKVAEVRGVTLYDDFAHHPTAIATTLDGLRKQVGADTQVIAIVEPRSNSMKLGAHRDGLPDSVRQADQVLWYAPPNLGWDLAATAAQCAIPSQVGDTLEAIIEQVRQQARPGAQVVIMSNGGFGGLHGKLAAALAE